jgi:hypothetical protein
MATHTKHSLDPMQQSTAENFKAFQIHVRGHFHDLQVSSEMVKTDRQFLRIAVNNFGLALRHLSSSDVYAWLT